MAEKENDGFEDLTETKNVDSGADDSTSTESVEATAVEEGNESESVEVDPSSARIAELESTIAIHLTEIGLKDAEIEKWKNLNLQLLLQMPNDGNIADETPDDSDMDDPVETEEKTGASSLFETKDN